MSIRERLFRATTDGGAFGAITDRTLAGLRLLLSVSALLIILIDPSEPSRFATLTYYALVAYVLYSLTIYLFAHRHTNFSQQTMQYLTWGDVLWYSAMITLGTSTNSVFFFFYLFAIIAGSSRGGTKLGLTLTVACTAVFLTLNILLISELQLDIPRFVRRTVYMAVLGYILAYWGGAEALLRRRLTFLKELSLLANPRLGVDRTIRHMLRRLLDFYHADYCFLLLGGSGRELTFYYLTKDSVGAESAPMRVREGTEIPLVNSGDPTTAVYVQKTSLWGKKSSYKSYDFKTDSVRELPLESAVNTAEALNVRSFITASLRYRERVRGRVLVGASEPRPFEMEDAIFLQQAADQVLQVIENIRIVDHLASDAAEEERRKIARSVHDRVIQPYLGLQLGLKALQKELFPAERRAATATAGMTMLDQLIAMTREGIDELRQYIGDLKQTGTGATPLVDSIRRFADKFENGTGIHVDVVDGASGLMMNDRLAAEVFQMTTEALSNIHRHTQSRNALVRLALVDNNLELSVENDTTGESPASFKPLSIFERAEALGARTEILSLRGKTQVRVEVPL